MRITWDERKDQANRRKRAVSFATAALVFEDPNCISIQDRIERGEYRWQTLGLVRGMVLLLVAHTWVDVDGEGHVRIISARQATRRERHLYETGPE